MSSIGTVDDSETKLFIPLSREPSGPPTPLAGNNVTNQTTEEQPSVVESFDDFDLMAPRKLFDSAKKEKNELIMHVIMFLRGESSNSAPSKSLIRL